MIDCVDFKTMSQLLLDGELLGEDFELARAHLRICETCAEAFAEDENLSQLLRRNYVPGTAPSTLRDRVLQSISAASSLSSESTAGERSRTHEISLVRRTAFSFTPARQLALVAASIFVLIGLYLFPSLQNRVRANSFIDAAISGDLSLSSHLMPLDVQTSSPQKVTEWFKGRVPFTFRLPNAGMASDENAKYTLAGGRLVTFRGENAALIEFRMANERMSLLIASDTMAKAEGGSVNISDGVALHRREKRDRTIVTWDNKGLTYALVFAHTASRGRTCNGCHQHSSSNDAETNQWRRRGQYDLPPNIDRSRLAQDLYPFAASNRCGSEWGEDWSGCASSVMPHHIASSNDRFRRDRALQGKKASPKMSHG
jgi:anti-sigma factor RsiW